MLHHHHRQSSLVEQRLSILPSHAAQQFTIHVQAIQMCVRVCTECWKLVLCSARVQTARRMPHTWQNVSGLSLVSFHRLLTLIGLRLCVRCVSAHRFWLCRWCACVCLVLSVCVYAVRWKLINFSLSWHSYMCTAIDHLCAYQHLVIHVCGQTVWVYHVCAHASKRA